MDEIINKVFGLTIVVGSISLFVIPVILCGTAASFILKRFGLVSDNSAWVTETRYVKIAKYALLAIILLVLAALVKGITFR